MALFSVRHMRSGPTPYGLLVERNVAQARAAGDGATAGVYSAPMPAESVYRVIVVGAGFGGLGMAMALKRAGIHDFLVVDKADDLGGTWRDNTYPGAACDVPANLYSYSFQPGRWSRRFPPQPETLAYLRALSRGARARPAPAVRRAG